MSIGVFGEQVKTIDGKNYGSYLIYFFTTILSLTFPMLSFFFCVLLVIYTNNYRFIKSIPVSLMFFFIIINFNKDFFHQGNDLLWYYSYFKNFSNYELGFLDAFEDDSLASVSLKATEPIYHFIVYASSKLSNGFYPIYILWVHCLIYLIPTFVIINVCKIERVSIFVCLSLILFQMLVFYDFGNAYNMIRQQVASSFIVLSFYYMYTRNTRLCLIFCIVAVLTHNSTVLFSSLVFIFCLYNLKVITYKYVLLFSSLLSFVYVLVYFNISGGYEELEDQSRGFFLKILDFSLFFLSGIVVMFLDSKHREIFRFVFVLFIALIFSHLSSFLPLRFLTFYDSFKWLVYFILITFVTNKMSKYHSSNIFIFAISLALSFLYFNLKLTYTTYSYSGLFLDFIFDSPVFYLGTNL